MMNNYKVVIALFIVIFLVEILQLFSMKILYLDKLYFDSLLNQMSYEKIQELSNESKKWAWLGYAIIPLIYLIKFSLVSTCLYIGAFFMNKRLKFSELFLVAIKAETVFIFLSLFKIIWFSIFKTDYTYLDFATFSPMSLLSIVGMESVDKIWHYPLQVFSLFELIYWFVLAFGVKELLEKDLAPSFKLVLSSYGLGLLSWIVVIMFITATLS
ncbi:MAG: hypothetical protein U5N85_22275 [Arcicella sp.]|nr:hypothetical protein [Arcicella sp.]